MKHVGVGVCGLEIHQQEPSHECELTDGVIFCIGKLRVVLHPLPFPFKSGVREERISREATGKTEKEKKPEIRPAAEVESPARSTLSSLIGNGPAGMSHYG